MKKEEVLFSRTVISGINFLICEAESQPNKQVLHILRTSLRDVCLALENQAADSGRDHIERILGSDLFLAIQFLSKYASIKDAELRKEVLQEIEAVKVAVNGRKH
jgi:hypothetical protein